MEDLNLLEQLGETLQIASLCELGKSAPNPVMTSLRYFRGEYMEHIVNKRCPAGVCKNLTIYYIDQEACIGCGICSNNCPVNAIAGEGKKPHKIHQEQCITCGICFNKCPANAVKIGVARMNIKINGRTIKENREKH